MGKASAATRKLRPDGTLVAIAARGGRLAGVRGGIEHMSPPVGDVSIRIRFVSCLIPALRMLVGLVNSLIPPVGDSIRRVRVQIPAMRGLIRVVMVVIGSLAAIIPAMRMPIRLLSGLIRRLMMSI